MPILNAQNLDDSVLDEFDLIYISEDDLCITRRKEGEGFAFYNQAGKKIADKRIIERLQSIGVPPTYRNAIYCQSDNGHLQAVANDANNNKQYFYHDQWEILRQKTKFTALYDFGLCLPAFRDKIRTDMKSDSMHGRVLAAMFRIMDRTGMRVGSAAAADNNDTYGLTTLERDHIEINGNTIHFEYDGKGGTHISTDLCDGALVDVIDECTEIDGQHIFGYIDDSGESHSITSSTINRFLKQQMGEEFSAKDFRTWRFSCIFLKHLLKAINSKDAKITLKSLLEKTSGETGNTPAILQSSYIHPGLIQIAKNPDIANTLLQNDPPVNYNFREEEAIFLTYLKTDHATQSLL